MEPTEQNTSPTPVTDNSTIITPTRRIEPTDAELLHQVDGAMATAASPSVVPEAPDTVVVPGIIGPAVIPTAPTPQVFGSTEPTPQIQPITAQTPIRKRSLKKPLIIAGVLVLAIAGASVAAYAAVIVPNKPENVLISALDNTLQQKQVSYKGSIDITSNDTAGKVEINGAHDGLKHADDVTLNATTSGITLPVEARLVDKNAYIKFGDLTPVTTLLSAYAGAQATDLVKVVNQQVSNKWITIDSTLLAQSGADCVLNSDLSLTKDDVALLKSQYKANPFAMIESSAGDTVNGQSVTKYQLSIDDDKAVKYGASLDKLSLVSALTKCNKDSTKTGAAVGDHEKTPLTVWVNRQSKQIVQIASQSTAADAKKGIKGSGQISFAYAPVSITAPSGSTPAITVFTNLQKALNTGRPGVGSQSTFDFTGLLGGVGAQTKALLR